MRNRENHYNNCYNLAPPATRSGRNRAILKPCASSAHLRFFALACSSAAAQTYLGLDRNDYPGDASMLLLHKTFAFTGYWLNNPPGAERNTWTGHRAQLESMGYGFLLLFNGREYAELKASGNAAGVGARDAAAAVSAAKSEGFPPKSVIFLDQEQGGRMLPEQRAYIHAWVDGVTASGYGAGVYCSGIPFKESSQEFGGDRQRHPRKRRRTRH